MCSLAQLELLVRFFAEIMNKLRMGSIKALIIHKEIIFVFSFSLFVYSQSIISYNK